MNSPSFTGDGPDEAGRHDAQRARDQSARAQRLDRLLDLLQPRAGVIDARPLGRLDRDQDVAAVLDRRELLRDRLEQVDGGKRDHGPDRQDHERDVERARQDPAIAVDHALEDRLGQAVDRPVRRHHQLRAHHRRQRAGDDAGEEDRGGELDRELAEQTPGVAGHEGERHEHRHQRAGRRDDREADLARAVEGGEQRRLAVLDAAVDVLDLDDRVVDDDADGEHDREQGQDVDRGAEERHHHERGDDRDRDRDHGDDGRAPVAQENQDDEDDEADALEERLQHAVDRGADEVRLVIHDAAFRCRAAARP